MDICGCTKQVAFIDAWGDRFRVKDFISITRKDQAAEHPPMKVSIWEDLRLLASRGDEPAFIQYEDGTTRGSETKVVDGVDTLTAFVEFLLTASCQSRK